MLQDSPVLQNRPIPAGSRPSRLRFELRDDALGIGVATPRLSWSLPPDVKTQQAYAVESHDGRGTGWGTGWVAGPARVLIAWPFAPLRSRERRGVRVRVRTDLGESDWSHWAWVETGILDPAHWVAELVGVPAQMDMGTPGFRPAYRLRGEFLLPRPVTEARLYVTAHGIHETWLNGVRVGEEELAPGFTEYATRTHVSTHDVTALLTPGDNALGAVLADGWFRGSVGMPRSRDQFGSRTGYLAQLHVRHDDGSESVVATGPGWRAATSHILAADLIEGQSEDRRSFETQWCRAGFDASGWVLASVRSMDRGCLAASAAPPIRRIEVRAPHRITTMATGDQIVDFGQNLNGWTRLSALGPAGSVVTLVHAEALGPDGDVTTDHLRPDDIPFIRHEVRAGMVDRVISAGRVGDAFEPRLTTHGFRYVRVAGLPRPLEAGDIAAVVVHSDLPVRGGFRCSDDDLNRLHEAAVWSFRGNACGIPTDCPTRERAGWSGDWGIYAPVATFHHDVAGFSTSWLRDLAAGAFDSGIIGNMAPMPPAERTGFLERLNGSAGWGDAIVTVPWEMYQEYGDTAILSELWPAMTGWVGYAEQQAATRRHPDRAARSPEPAAYEKFLWDTGFHWGEWLEPGVDILDFDAFLTADKGDVATAYLAHSATLMAEIAGVLGRRRDADHYRLLADGARSAWQAEYLDPAGRVRPATQATCVRALTLGLVPDEARSTVATQLRDLVRDNGNRLATGFLATRDLLPALADSGSLDTAYALLQQRGEPSWLAMLDRGATTMWERWDGVSADGIPSNSLNHYAKGAFIGFLHGHVAGLRRTSPMWRTFRVEPRPEGGVTWASAHHETPLGRAAVDWQLTGARLRVTVTVPADATATLALPDGSSTTLGAGTHRRTSDV